MDDDLILGPKDREPTDEEKILLGRLAFLQGFGKMFDANWDGILINVYPSMADKEIFELICQMFEAKEAGRNVLMITDGFNNDPRELHEIPEAIKLFDRLWNLGFPAFLDMKSEHRVGWGSIELWLNLKDGGQYPGKTAIGKGALVQFCKDLQSSSEQCKKFLEEMLK